MTVGSSKSLRMATDVLDQQTLMFMLLIVSESHVSFRGNLGLLFMKVKVSLNFGNWLPSQHEGSRMGTNNGSLAQAAYPPP